MRNAVLGIIAMRTRNRWDADNIGSRFPFLNSIRHGGTTQAEAFSPFYGSKGNSIMGYQYIGGTVSALFCRCRPTAIFRRVWSIVINAVKLVLRGGPFAHIGKKVFKKQPRGAKGNTSTTISRIASSLGIQTSSFHRAPDIKLRCIGSAVSKSVALSEVSTFFEVFAGSFFMKTTAGFNVAITHCCKQYRGFIAAFTQALNNNLAVDVSADDSHDGKPSRGEPDKLLVRYALHW